MVLLAPAIAALAVFASPARAGPLHGSVEENYWLRIPATWAWETASAYAKHGTVEAARRDLEGATGQGARTLLTRQDVPADLDASYEGNLAEWQVLLPSLKKKEQEAEGLKAEQKPIPPALEAEISALTEKRTRLGTTLSGALRKLGESKEVLAALGHRYGEKASGTEIEFTTSMPGTRLPALEVSMKGAAPNLSGTEGPCEGHMYVWVVRKKLWRLATWIWAEGRAVFPLRTDRDEIELNFAMPNTDAIPARPDPAAPDPSAKPVPPVGDSGEERAFEDRLLEVRMVKPKGFESRRGDGSKDTDKNLVWEFRALDRKRSEATVTLSAFLITPKFPATDIDNWSTKRWAWFLRAHPTGDIASPGFPSVAEKTPYLSLPDFAKKRPVERPTPDRSGQVVPLTRADLEKRGIVGEATKNAKIDAEKPKSMWRLALQGTLADVGDDIFVEYAFSTRRWSYLLTVQFRHEGVKLYGDSVAAILSSLRLIPPAK